MNIKIGNVEGMMNICIPYITIEPIVSKLSSSFWFSSVRRSSTTQYLGTLKEKLADVEMELVADIGSINVPIKVGEPLTLSVGSQKKFYCQAGNVGKKVAVQIIGKIDEQDSEEFEELTPEGDDEL